MKRISKILGVGLTLAVLASLMVVSLPVSAGTLSWSAESLPSSTGNVLAANKDIVGLAVGAGGNPIFAATGTTTLYKSTNSGTSWTALALTNDTDLVAIAPDDSNVVVIVDQAAASVNMSVDGGTTFFSLGASNVANIRTVDIAPLVSGIRNIVVGGDDTLGNIAIARYDFGNPTGPTWVSMNGTAWGNNSIAPVLGNSVAAVKFSPKYSGDRTMVAIITESVANNITVQVASFASSRWNNQASGFTNYDGVQNVIASGALTKASLALPSTYNGVTTTDRIAYVGLDLVTVGTASGFYRLNDVVKTQLKASVDINSVDTIGTALLAGASASNAVYTVASPATATAAGVVETNFFKRPGANVGSSMVVVAFSGTLATAGTSGTENAFSVSKDNGLNFNDISLIDTNLNQIDDILVSANGSTVYMVSSQGGYTSLWRKTAAWERVFDSQVANTAVKAVPENADIVWLAGKGVADLYYSTDAGEKTWTYRIAPAAIGDVAVESATVVYVGTTAGGVSKSTDAGFIWSTPTVISTVAINSLVSMGAGNLIAGDASGGVDYSINGTWTAAGTAGSGAVVVTADKVATGGFIYAGSAGSDQLYSWKIDPATAAWTAMRASSNSTHSVKGIGLSGGTLYAVASINSASDNTSLLLRTLSPSTAASSDAAFSVVTSTGMSFDKLQISTGPKLWTVNKAATPNTVQSYTDTLAAAGPTLVEPADKARIAVNTQTGQALDVSYSWNRPSTATKYDFQIALDSAFTKLVRSETGIAKSDAIAVLILGPNSNGGLASTQQYAPGQTYYWRVRVSQDGPVYSPYSAVRSFTIDGITTFEIVGPAVGATGVDIFPTFSWTPYAGAIGYEVMVSEDPTFAIIDFSRSTTQTFFKSEEQLAYNTTYYWRVRGVTGPAPPKEPAPGGPWQNGIFTTAARPAAPPGPTVITIPGTPPPAQVIQVPVPQPQPIPSYLLWAIIGIGAVLLIALIVLIVRTRRVS